MKVAARNDDERVTLLRPYSDRLFSLVFGVFLLGGAVALGGLMLGGLSWGGWIYCGLAALFTLWLGIFSLRYAVLPFRIDVDRVGWTVRTPDLDRYLRWDEIEAVAIAPGPKRSERLIVAPAPGVRLDVPQRLRATLDDRPAVELFRLSEVAYDEAALARDLAELGGDRFQNRVARLTLPPGVPLGPFPDAPGHARLRRWLNRRTALLFTGWYLLVLLPALTLVVLAADAHELLGAAALLPAVAGVGAALAWAASIFSGCRQLTETSATIDGAYLVASAYDIKRRVPLQAGAVAVLPPGSKRGYGKAWLLADTSPCLLLSSPQTGELRDAGDLRLLSAVLRESAHESDRAAGAELDRLAAELSPSPATPTTPAPPVSAPATSAPTPAIPSPAPALPAPSFSAPASPAPSFSAPASPAPATFAPATSAPVTSAPAISAPATSEPARTADGANLWIALAAIGRVVGWFAVVATVALAGGAIIETSSFVGPALIFGAVALFGVWVLYALYRVLGLLGALLCFAGRVFYARG
jgi:hypothetical protein